MIEAGQLRYPVRLITPGKEAQAGRWVPLRRAWADRKEGSRNTIFSSVGLAARTVIFILRRQTIAPGDIIEWRGQWHYIVSYEHTEQIWLTVTTATVFPVECAARRVKQTGKGKGNRPVKETTQLDAFTGILTEKYAGYDLGDAHATGTQTMVLVTTKGAELEVADLVTVTDGPMPGTVWNVTKAHLLDPAKNEYEMTRKEDA